VRSLAIIPACNEARAIAGVVRGVAAHVNAVVVVDDGSTDETGRLAQEAGAQTLVHAHNLGKGRSLRDGLNWGVEHGFEALLTLDGDGQHLPEEAPHLFAELGAGADLVVGNRMTESATMPWVRRKTNEFMSWLVSRLARAPIPDTQCGYRLFRAAVWTRVEPLVRTSGFDFESEVLVHAGRLGFRITPAQISTVYGEERSNIRPVRDTIRFFRMVLRLMRRPSAPPFARPTRREDPAMDTHNPGYDFEQQRDDMVRRQLAGRDIADERVLAAFREVPRHRFIDPAAWDEAYDDHPVGIGKGQTISQPYIVALMTQLLEVQPGMKVLEVGTGSGYQAAILAQLGATVHGVERHEALTREARAALDDLGLGDRVFLHVADGTLGLPHEAPYDRIIVTAAAPGVPEALKQQLSPGQGRMVLPVGRAHQQLTVVIRDGEDFRVEPKLAVMFVPLIGEQGF